MSYVNVGTPTERRRGVGRPDRSGSSAPRSIPGSHGVWGRNRMVATNGEEAGIMIFPADVPNLSQSKEINGWQRESSWCGSFWLSVS